MEPNVSQGSPAPRLQRVLGVVVAVVVGAGVMYFLNYWTWVSARCEAGNPVRCEATLTALHSKAYRACWSVQATCRNGAKVSGKACGVLRKGQPAAAVIDAASLEPGGCDEATSVEARVIETKRLVL
jgi:hypothetical protein